MRRALPWALVALLTAGVAAGAGLSATTQGSAPTSVSAAQELSGIIAATRAAGTARFTFSDVGSSKNPDLRSSRHGQGVVDFSSDSLRVSEQDRSTGFSGTSTQTLRATTQDTVMNNVWIGRTEYLQFGTVGTVGATRNSPWIKQPAWPKNSFGALGPLEDQGPLGELELQVGVPGYQLEDRGAAVVRGIRSTSYVVVPAPTCKAGKEGKAGKAAQTAPDSIGPVELWVDGRDRLLQVRASTRFDFTKAMLQADRLPDSGQLPDGGAVEIGRATDVSTMELSDFGAPVEISAPPVRHLQGSSSTGFAEIKAKRSTCT